MERAMSDIEEFAGRVPLIPEERVAEIKAHARTAIRGAREIVGVLVIVDGVAVRYERLRNWAKGDDSFSAHWVDIQAVLRQGERFVLVHSHPSSFGPSGRDLRGCGEGGLEKPYGIFHCIGGTLDLYVLHRDRKGFTPLPTVIV